METYQITAKDKEGKNIQLEISAESQHDAINQCKQQGHLVLSVNIQQEPEPKPQPTVKKTKPTPKPVKCIQCSETMQQKKQQKGCGAAIAGFILVIIGLGMVLTLSIY